MWRLLEKNEVPLIGDEVLQSGSLFTWLPVINNVESSTGNRFVIRRKIEDAKELGASDNSHYVAALVSLRVVEDGNKGRAWNEAVDACIEEIQRLNAVKAPHCT